MSSAYISLHRATGAAKNSLLLAAPFANATLSYTSSPVTGGPTVPAGGDRVVAVIVLDAGALVSAGGAGAVYIPAGVPFDMEVQPGATFTVTP